MGAVYIWPYSRAKYALVLSLWIPVYLALFVGQDLGLLLFGLSAFIRTPTAFPACLAKYQLLWLVPLSMTRRAPYSHLDHYRRLCCRSLCYGLPHGLLIMCRSVLMGRAVISNPENLFPMLGWYGLPLAAIAAVWIVRKCSREMAILSLVVLGVLVSPHAYLYDYTLAAPLCALVWERSRVRVPALAAA
jgi:hypothetical protein